MIQNLSWIYGLLDMSTYFIKEEVLFHYEPLVYLTVSGFVPVKLIV